MVLPMVDLRVALKVPEGVKITAMAISQRLISFSSQKGVLDFIDKSSGSELASLAFNEAATRLVFTSNDAEVLLREESSSSHEDGSYQLCRLDNSVITRTSLPSTELLLPSDFGSKPVVYPQSSFFFAIKSKTEGLYLSAPRPGRSPRITRLHSGIEITAVCWKFDLLAWSTPEGVWVVDVKNNQKIAAVEFPSVKGIYWIGDTKSVLAVWGGKRVGIIEISSKYYEIPDNDKIQISITQNPVKIFDTNEEILSVTSFQSEHQQDIAIFTKQEISSNLVIHVFSCDSGELISSQVVADLCVDIEISPCASLPVYLQTSTFVYQVSARSISQHAEFFLQANDHEKALMCAEKSGDVGLIKRVAFASVRPFLENNRFESAKRIIPMLEATEEQWGILVAVFEKFKAMPYLMNSVPFPPVGIKLQKHVYERIVKEIAKTQPTQLLSILRKWPLDELVDVSSFVEWLSGRIDLEISSPLQESFQFLLEKSGDLPEALTYALKRRNFQEISELLCLRLLDSPAVRDWALVNAAGIITIAPKVASEIFADHSLVLTPALVVEALEGQPQLEFSYLRALFDRDAKTGLIWNQRLLLGAVNFDASWLFIFLQKWSLDKSNPLTDKILNDILPLLEGTEFLQAKAFVLWKLQRPYDSLQILLNKKIDIIAAVRFAAEVKDSVLWDCIFSNVISSGDSERIDELLKALKDIGDAENTVMPSVARASQLFKRLMNSRDEIKLSRIMIDSLIDAETESKFEVMVDSLIGLDALEAKKRMMNTMRGATIVELRSENIPQAMKCCFCARRLSLSENEIALEPLLDLTVKELQPNRVTENPWIAVYRDGRVAHSACLADLTLNTH